MQTEYTPPRDLFEQAMVNAGDAVIFADAEGTVRFWNRRAVEVFGYTAAEVLGRSLDIIIPEKHRERHWEGYRRVMATGQSRYQSGALLAVPAARSDGGQISVEFTLGLVASDDGSVAGVVAIMRDVTERWRRERELQRRLAEAKGEGD